MIIESHNHALQVGCSDLETISRSSSSQAVSSQPQRTSRPTALQRSPLLTIVAVTTFADKQT